MKILFVGCIGISRTMLKTLIEHGELICGVVCIPERFCDSTSGYDDLSDLAIEYKIPIHKSRRLHTKKCIEFIKGLKPDLMVVYGWQRIIKPEVLTLFKKSVGFHASLLPKYRGSAPVNWAIINGETETGVTMFQLDKEVDAGPIYGQKSFAITLDDDCATTYEKSADAACGLILEKLPEWKNGRFETSPNVSANHPIMPRRKPVDGLVDWHKTVQENYNWIRALTKPYPGAFTIIENKKYILWASTPVNTFYIPPKSHIIDPCGIFFGCSDGVLLVTKYEVVDADQ